MNLLLNIVKEQGILDIIEEYKIDMEKYELDEKIKINNQKINKIRNICKRKDYLIKVSTNTEIENTSIPFSITDGRTLPLTEFYREQIKNGYKKVFKNIIYKKLEELRETNIELQIEKLLKYEEEEIIEIINEDEPTILIGATGHNNLHGITLDIGITNPYV